MKVFISFAVGDHRLVHVIAGALIDAGIEPVVATERRAPGTSLDKKVLRLISDSDAVVAVLTPRSSLSVWVQQEIGAAIARRKLVVPVRTRGGATLPAMLQGVEYLSMKISAPLTAALQLAAYLREFAQDKGLPVGAPGDNYDDYGRLLHLPKALICPGCQRVDNHVWVCLLCGDWVCGDCGETIPPNAVAVDSSSI